MVHSASSCIVVTSGKGGVGKTTVTANLGTALARLGHSVVVLDADIGLRNLDVVLGMEKNVRYDFVDVINGLVPLQEALVWDGRESNLALLPAAQTATYDSVHLADFQDLINNLRLQFEFVLIDCPAGVDRGFQHAVNVSDQAIVVATPEVSSVRDADRVCRLIETIGQPEPLLMLNKVRFDLVEQGDMLDKDDVVEILALPLIGLLPDTEEVIIATNRGLPCSLDSNSIVGECFSRIARRLTGEAELSLLCWKRERNWWSTLRRWVSRLTDETNHREAM